MLATGLFLTSRHANTFRTALAEAVRKYSVQLLLCVAYFVGDPALAELQPIPPDQQLTPPLRAFEYAAAVYGDVALVGVPELGSNGTSSVQVYERVQHTDCKNQLCWVYTQTLFPPDLEADSLFGTSIAFDGHTALIGAPSSHAGQEAIYFYERRPQGWVMRQKLSSGVTDSPTNFGRRVALRGDVAATTSVGYGRQGAVYFFHRQEDGTWRLSTSITPPDAVPDLEFGYSLGLDHHRAIVGGNGAGPSRHDVGAAYVFRRRGDQWVMEQKLASSDGGQGSFGQSCDIEGDVAVVGAHTVGPGGAAYVFIRGKEGWNHYQKVTPTRDDQNWNLFGTSVRLVRGVLGVAAETSAGFGALYVFAPVHSKLTDVLKFAYPSGPIFEPQGIATDGRTLIINGDDGIRWLWNLPPQ